MGSLHLKPTEKTQAVYKPHFSTLTSLAFLFLTAASCSTLLESASPTDSTQGYSTTKNEKGQTVHRRQRYVGPSSTPVPWPTPSPTPWPTPVPLVIQEIETQRNVEPTIENLAGGTVIESTRVTQLEDHPLYVEPKNSNKGGIGLGLELGFNQKHFHLNGMLLHEFGFVDGKLGISLFKSGDDLYAGLDLGARPKLKLNEDVALFAGLGVYGGDSKKCQTTNDIETCEKKFLFAGYLEAGAYLGSVSLFARKYAIEEAGRRIPSDLFYGIGFHTDY